MLNKLECPDKNQKLCVTDPKIIIPYQDTLPLEKMIAS